MKEVEKLAVGPGGVLTETGQRQINLSEINELQECKYEPYGHETVLQLLPPSKEQKTVSGIILPVSTRGEIKGVVAATNSNSGLKRGDLVRLDLIMFPKEGPWVDYIDGKPFMQVPNHFIKGVYANIDLSNWKAE